MIEDDDRAGEHRQRPCPISSCRMNAGVAGLVRPQILAGLALGCHVYPPVRAGTPNKAHGRWARRESAARAAAVFAIRLSFGTGERGDRHAGQQRIWRALDRARAMNLAEAGAPPPSRAAATSPAAASSPPSPAASALPPCRAGPPSRSRRQSVAIVGGGLAGLAALDELRNHGVDGDPLRGARRGRRPHPQRPAASSPTISPSTRARSW